MKKLLQITLTCWLGISLFSCKTVENAETWVAFNDSIQKNSPKSAAKKLADDTVYYDGKSRTFYRMNLYWRMVEIKPDSQGVQPEDFTYKWFTSYDNESGLTPDSLIQNIQMYLFKDGRAVLRSLVFPEAKTKRTGRFGWKSSYRLNEEHLHTLKYVKKNKIRWGSFKVMEYTGGKNRLARIQLDLYSPLIGKKSSSGHKIPAGDKVTLTVRLSHFGNDLQVSGTPDPIKDITGFVKDNPKQSRPDTSRSVKKVGIDGEIKAQTAGLNRAVVEYIDFKSDIGSNGGEFLKIAPRHIFGLGDVKGRFPAEMYFRLFEITAQD